MTDSEEESPRSLRYVGPVTAEILTTAAITAADIEHKRVSYRQLVNEGVNPGVAAKIRREHSLPWTISGFESDLDTRSRTVRGLRADERRWIAQSGADWEARDSVGISDPQADPNDGYAQELELTAAPETLAPTTSLEPIDDATAAALAEAGVNTVQRLAVVEQAQLAAAIDVEEGTVARWQEAAQTYLADRDGEA